MRTSDVEKIIREASRLIAKRDFDGAVAYLSNGDPQTDNPMAIVARLRGMYAARTMVPGYNGFCQAAREALTARGYNGERLLRGLP